MYVLSIREMMNWWKRWWRTRDGPKDRVATTRWEIDYNLLECDRMALFDEYLEMGKELIGRPIKKCPGVKELKSLGSEDKGISGQLFKIPSTWLTTVKNYSIVNIKLPIVLSK
ncbi:anoctamin [Trichonephila clavipes]|nr:anoctamin [Trichonephila clavipes]